MESKWEIAAPRADALIESLRAFGYSPETAVADLVDNSISAGAKSVEIEFHWAGATSWVCVLDDGAGMGEDQLKAAMRPGSMSPLEDRSKKDLGRFGLGLKTASFSQARELTVLTRTSRAGAPSVRRWDLDTVADSGEWRLLRHAPSSGEFPDPLGSSIGTAVIWTKCDRLVGDAAVTDVKAQNRFLDIAERVSRHLEATFHRFMIGRGKVGLTVNGRPLKPWDPFMEGHPATQCLGVERLPYQGATVAVTPYVLPHRSKLDEREQRDGSGLSGWNHQQGFYIYRENRLLVHGDWMHLGFGKEEHAKLARISVDFPSSLDHDWQIDVKKSSARPPGALIEALRRIGSATRRQAEEVYRHRGKVMVQRTAQPFVLAWQQVKLRDGEIGYRVNREHPVIQSLLTDSISNRRSVERALRFIEETIPTTLIGVSIADALDSQSTPFAQARREVRPMLDFVFSQMVVSGVEPSEALAKLAAAEPFVHYPGIVEEYKELKL